MKHNSLHYAKHGEEVFIFLYATDNPSRPTDFDGIWDAIQNAKCVIFTDILEQQFDFALRVIDWCLKSRKRIMLIPSTVPKAVLPTLKEHTIKGDSPECAVELISTALAASGRWPENTKVGSICLDLPYPCAFNEFSLNFAVYSTLLPAAQKIADHIRALDLNELETIIWIDNWMQQNVQYIKNRESNGPGGSNDVYICEDITEQAIVPDVLLHHYGVCEDIAASVATIASLLEIDCAVIQGGAHAWNLVTLDEKTYILDSTHNITRNPNRMVDALKATKYTSQFTLVGADKESADDALLAEIDVCISPLDFPREPIRDAISKLRGKGVLFEYGTHVTYKSRRKEI